MRQVDVTWVVKQIQYGLQLAERYHATGITAYGPLAKPRNTPLSRDVLLRQQGCKTSDYP
jgi:hypothetical protein